MQIQDALSITGAVFASLGGGAIIVFCFSNWLGKIWANRLLEGDRLANSKELQNSMAENKQSPYDGNRKLERLLHHYERQIEEFYGPLFNAVHQIFVANHIQFKLLNASDDHGNKFLTADKAESIREYYQSAYFRNLHNQVREIIGTKLYLIDETAMPDSFYQYLQHSAQEHDQRALWAEYQVNTDFLKGQPWPSSFHKDIKQGFETAMKNYHECLDELKS